MAKNRKEEAAEPAAMRLVAYPGPHAEVTLKNVPELGELTLRRGVKVELPEKIAGDLIKRKKVKAASSATLEEQKPPAE